ncbi:hypothetical protein F6X37_35700, partial [Paraburkholderia sp. 31.1]|uniref:Ig-like domain-containing protein n=1 Tax=Paraburkholderia sp. 31.1 TaxID=2615205 RepID=UPI001D2633C2
PDTPLDEGEHEFTVVERDPAGNESRPSEPHVVIVDTTAPDQPVIGEVIDDEGPIQGPVGNGESTDDTTPTLVGKGEPGDTIVVIDNGTPIGETKVDEDGNWSFTPDTPLDEGEHEFTVVERDPAGNESGPSEPHVVVVDTTAPDQPVIGEVIDDEGPIQGPVGNGESTDDTTPTLVGKGEPGDTIIVIDNGTPVGETQVDEDGNWSFTPDTPLDEGEHEFTVVERDPAGNESGPSEPHVVIVDTTAPDQPVIGEVIDDVGLVQGPVGNGESTDDTTPTLVGKGEPGDTIIVIDNGTPVGETQVDEDGNWSFTPDTPLEEGEHEFTVVERDPAGNESRPSEPHVVIVDTVAPTAEASITYMGKDSGNVDFLTHDGSAGRLIMGSLTDALAPGEMVQVSTDDGKTWHDALIDDKGNWLFQDDTAHAADWTIQTRVVDADGSSGEVVSQNVALKTSGPGAPASWELHGNTLTVVLPEGAAVGDRVIFNNGTVNSIDFGYVLTPSDIASGIKVVDAGLIVNSGGWISGVGLVDGAGNLYLNTHHHEDFETATWSIGKDNWLNGFNGFTVDSAHLNGFSSAGGDRGLVLGAKGALVSESIAIKLEDPTSSVSLRLSKVGIGSGNFVVYLDAAGHELGRTAITSSTGSVDYHFDAPLNGEPIAMVKLEFAYSEDSVMLLDFSFDTLIDQQHAAFGPFVGNDESNIFTFGYPELLASYSEKEGLSNFEGGAISFDGQGGIDTLKLSGAGLTLDLLNEHHGKLSSIEVFDITGTGNNTLRLSLGDVLDLGGKDLFVADGRTQVMVKGNAGDRVDLSDLLPDGGDVGNWMQQSGTTTVGGVAYDVFYHSGLNAELLVQHGVDTTLLNH